MTYLLDTNIAIGLRDGDAGIIDRVEQLSDQVIISVVTRIELEGAIAREPARAMIRQLRLDTLLERLSVAPFDNAAAEIYRRILQTAGFSRRKILDRMIAAQAIALDAELVTMNAADFSDVPGLTMVAW